MARQGKETDSPAKTAIRKAKKAAAAKSRQDLAGAFATKTVKVSYDIDLDAVDKSPTQIPRKPVMIPASSLAPQNPPTKAQGDFKDPPEEVEIDMHDPPLHHKTRQICPFQQSVLN